MATRSTSRGYPAVYTGIRRNRPDGYTRPVYVLEHRLVAERALGKPLPTNAVIHHVDENTGNATNTNLVICQDQAYHKLLHQRADALKACGHASWLRCAHCKGYDAPERLRVYQRKSRVGFVAEHQACRTARDRRAYASAGQ